MAHNTKSKTQKRNKKTKNEMRAPGCQHNFTGAKGEFLWSYQDKFHEYSEGKRGPFYSHVAQAFIDHFGYDLSVHENPGPDDAEDAHTPTEIDPSLSGEEFQKEVERQRDFYNSIQHVSVQHSRGTTTYSRKILDIRLLVSLQLWPKEGEAIRNPEYY